MKGVILAGGNGSRLFPSTKVTNKHLIPVFNKPMVLYPIETLKNSGVREILIITSSENIGDFMKLLGSGAEHGVDFTYKIQDGSGGIAQALGLAEDFSGGDNLAMILGDNIFEDDFAEELMRFKSGAQIFVKQVDDPGRFGVVEIDDASIVRSIEEKPAAPKSDLAQTGLFLYDNQVFSFIREIGPSERGELEITDVNNIYLRKSQLRAREFFGMWIDAGTHDSLLEASILAQEAFNPEQLKLRRTKRSLREQPKEVTPKITIGVVTHNSEKYVVPCIESLLVQNYENKEIVILDNQSSDDTLQILEKKFPEIPVIRADSNLGFARGHNQILRETDGDFYACVNIDAILEPNFLSALAKEIERKPIFGSASGKLKHWDYPSYLSGSTSKGKTNFIDTVGIRILKSHRFEDIGQGEVDFGQFDEAREVFGVSGAAVLYRRKALEDVNFKNEHGEREFFDESMFMYKEDVDLAYRLQWAGWKAMYAPVAVAYHDRTVGGKHRSALDLVRNRLKKSKNVNQNSYMNHRILLQKNFSNAFSTDIRSATAWYNLKVFLYILIFETELLGVWWKIFRMRKRIRAWRSAMPRRVSKTEIEKFMES
ncbi:glycosyltransferase [bacterium]|nr:glycosyltransferase [bacterium]